MDMWSDATMGFDAVAANTLAPQQIPITPIPQVVAQDALQLPATECRA